MVLNAQVEHKTYVELGRLLVPSLVKDLVVKAYKKGLFFATLPKHVSIVRVHLEFSDERRLCCGHWRSEGSEVIKYK